jgi:hypothetical protein
MIEPVIEPVIGKPRMFGFQNGKIRDLRKMILLMALNNCGRIAANLILTGSITPYNGNRRLLTEVVIFPLEEETFWRENVFFAGDMIDKSIIIRLDECSSDDIFHQDHLRITACQ